MSLGYVSLGTFLRLTRRVWADGQTRLNVRQTLATYDIQQSLSEVQVRYPLSIDTIATICRSCGILDESG